jgi:hypothetical protein
VKRKSRLSNAELIPLALYQLGGSGQFFDVEDIYLRCYDLAPERFGWRKHRLPNYKSLAKALQECETKYPELLLKTPDGLSRQLSAAGVEWLRARLPRLQELVGAPISSSRRPSHRLLNEMAAHPVVKAFIASGRADLIKHRVADLLLCAPDSPPAVWREQLETYRSAAADAGRADLSAFLEHLAVQRPEWFGGAE